MRIILNQSFMSMEKDNLKNLQAILVLKKTKNTKTLSWGSEFPSVTRRQRGFDTV